MSAPKEPPAQGPLLHVTVGAGEVDVTLNPLVLTEVIWLMGMAVEVTLNISVFSGPLVMVRLNMVPTV
jgi:hypothetical protein